MTATVKVAEAKAHLSQLLARVEAGEEIIIARGNNPVAMLSRVRKGSTIEAAMREIRALRERAKPVTQDEIRTWRDEGRTKECPLSSTLRLPPAGFFQTNIATLLKSDSLARALAGSCAIPLLV